MDFVSPYLTGTTLASSTGWFYARKLATAPSRELAQYIEKIGPSAWVEQQLYPERISESARYETERKALFPSTFIKPAGGKTRDKNFWDTYQRGAKNHPYDVSVYVLQSALHRLWRSNKHLEGKMAQFWADMLAVTIEKAPNGYHDYVGILFEGALGKYSDLLYNMTCSQTMALFLDNNTNNRYALNENMGRELMELHSWGPEKGYTQTDVINVAKLLTGLGGNTNYEFKEARPDLHIFGPIKVVGKTFRNGGSTAADMYRTIRELTDYLAHDRYTGLRIARRLIQFFVGQDQNYEALAQRLATTYVANDTAIRPVLRELFTSSEFLHSGGKTIRRPWEVLCSLMASGKLELKGTHNLSDTSAIDKVLYKMFMTLKYNCGLPFDAPATNGYSLDADSWINSVNYGMLTRFGRFTDYISTWDGASDLSSMRRWANTIVWSDKIGITLGKTTAQDAARKTFEYLTGYAANNTEIVNSIAVYAITRNSVQAAETRNAGNEVIANEGEVYRLVEAVLLTPHLLVA